MISSEKYSHEYSIWGMVRVIVFLISPLRQLLIFCLTNNLHKRIVIIFHIQYSNNNNNHNHNNNNKALHIYITNSLHPLMVMAPVFSLDK